MVELEIEEIEIILRSCEEQPKDYAVVKEYQYYIKVLKYFRFKVSKKTVERILRWI